MYRDQFGKICTWILRLKGINMQARLCSSTVAPSGPWHLSFAPVHLENLSFFHRNHFARQSELDRFRAQGLPSVLLRAQP